jgi:hypothetical protein
LHYQWGYAANEIGDSYQAHHSHEVLSKMTHRLVYKLDSSVEVTEDNPLF